MQLDIFFNLFFNMFLFALIVGVVLAWQLWRYMNADVRTTVRVHFKGGTEKRFDAVEIDEEIQWLQDGERMIAQIPTGVYPGHTRHWGIPYRIFNVISGGDEAILPPWHDARIITESTGDEAAAKERYRRRIRAADTFKQIAAGLSSLNRWQAAALVLLGLFLGLWLGPILQQAAMSG